MYEKKKKWEVAGDGQMRYVMEKQRGRAAAVECEKSMWGGPNWWLFIFYYSTHLGILFSCSLISGLEDGWIVIWNPLEKDEAKQKRILPLKHSDDWVILLSFSPDGRFLAAGDEKGDKIIWSTEVRNLVKKCVDVCGMLLPIYDATTKRINE